MSKVNLALDLVNKDNPRLELILTAKPSQVSIHLRLSQTLAIIFNMWCVILGIHSKNANPSQPFIPLGLLQKLGYKFLSMLYYIENPSQKPKRKRNGVANLARSRLSKVQWLIYSHLKTSLVINERPKYTINLQVINLSSSRCLISLDTHWNSASFSILLHSLFRLFIQYGWFDLCDNLSKFLQCLC